MSRSIKGSSTIVDIVDFFSFEFLCFWLFLNSLLWSECLKYCPVVT